MPSPNAPATAEELENSFPMDVGRRFREPANTPVLGYVLAGMRHCERRVRKRAEAAERRWNASVEAMLANLVASHLNVIDPSRYVAVSFNRNDYNDTELSRDALAICRDHLVRQGLIEVSPGFQRWDADGIGKFGRRSRLRPTAKLRAMINRCALHERSLTRSPQQLIQLKAAQTGVGAAPADVEDSRALLAAINGRLATTDIRLHGAMLPALERKIVENEGEEDDAAFRKRSYAGDLTAASLYRVFKYDWQSGGRIYGGWWMSLPRFARPYLTINGSPVVELDYKSLHPLLLYRRANAPMPDDPYLVGAGRSRAMRDLGKRTFNRLLNRRETDPSKKLTLKAAQGDKDVLKNVTFREYLAGLTSHLSAIAHWFGTGAGLGLQYEDSLLAIKVLRRLEEMGIPVLPIHDSFIVAEENEEQLRMAMEAAFNGYGCQTAFKRDPRSASKRDPLSDMMLVC